VRDASSVLAERADPGDLVMLVDAFDVLLLPAAADTLGRFAALAGGRSLLFGTERKCSPDKVSEGRGAWRGARTGTAFHGRRLPRAPRPPS